MKPESLKAERGGKPYFIPPFQFFCFLASGLFDPRKRMAMIRGFLMKRLALILAICAVGACAATVGYVSIETDKLPDQVYLDAISVPMCTAPIVVEVVPGKHFVSLFSPKKVYQAAADEAPDQFWDKLRSLGAIPDQPGLLSSYEAGSVRVGTNWVYVMPDDTVSVKLSHADVLKTYNHDAGCVAGTFIGWTAAIGATLVLAIILGRIGS